MSDFGTWTTIVCPAKRLAEIRKSHSGRVYSITPMPTCGGVTSAGQDGQVFLHHPQPAQTELNGPPGVPVLDIQFTADDRQLAVAGPGRVQLLDASTGSVDAIIAEDDTAWTSVAVDRQGKLLAAGSKDGTIHVWDIVKRSLQFSLDVGSQHLQRRVGFLTRRYATGCLDLESTGRCRATLRRRQWNSGACLSRQRSGGLGILAGRATIGRELPEQPPGVGPRKSASAARTIWAHKHDPFDRD